MKTHKTLIVTIIGAFLFTHFVGLSEAGSRTRRAPQATNEDPNKDVTEDLDLQQKQFSITRDYGDTDAWQEQRQKIAMATGDRIFDQDFGRVFDSLVVAVSSLELEVKNMERTSGYIQAGGMALRKRPANPVPRFRGGATPRNDQARAERGRHLPGRSSSNLCVEWDMMRPKTSWRYSDGLTPARLQVASNVM